MLPRFTAIAFVLVCGPASARGAPQAMPCDFSEVPGVVWWGPERELTVHELATSLAPVFWFSPDEPLLAGREGAEIAIPQAFPFESPGQGPVVYYQVDEIFVSDAEEPQPLLRVAGDGRSILSLDRLRGVNVTFHTYYPTEEGLGAHAHDVEPAAFRAVLLRDDDEIVAPFAGRCAVPHRLLVVARVTGMAHGLFWYWNVADTDRYSRFPMHLLVEEGKHGLATDRNGDGYFTPGFDVTRHPNDAWGTRDTIRTGALFSGGYESWMTKVRRPEDRIFPPFPPDSPMRRALARRGAYDRPVAEYELRPLPPLERAGADPELADLLEDKVVERWPEISTSSPTGGLREFVEQGNAFGSLAIAVRADGELGLSFAFPFLIVHNLEVPLTGGFVVWRLYLRGERLRDLGITLLYTPSASRWIDSYFSAGAELDRPPREDDPAADRLAADLVVELGLKARFNVTRSPVRFLAVLTDFWGVRLGIKNTGFPDIDRLTYVVELGAGAW